VFLQRFGCALGCGVSGAQWHSVQHYSIIHTIYSDIFFTEGDILVHLAKAAKGKERKAAQAELDKAKAGVQRYAERISSCAHGAEPTTFSCVTT
jgi:hypothetical protein